MARTLFTCSSGNAADTVANVVSNFPIGGGPAAQPANNEANAQIKINKAGTISNFFLNIIDNNITAGSTYRVRKNGANTTLVISVGSFTTGMLEDTTHSDTVAAGDLLNYQWTPGDTVGVFAPSVSSITFDNNKSSTDTYQRLSYASPNTVALMTGASTTYFVPIYGTFTGTTNTTESITQTLIEKAMVLSNFGIKVSANSRTTTTTAGVRKNGANSTITVSITSTQTGLIEDTTHTETLVAGTDKINNYVTNGTGTSAISYTSISSDADSTEYPGISYIGCNTIASTETIGPSVVAKVTIQGRANPNTNSESVNQLKARDIYTLSNLSITVGSNTITASSTIVVRHNTANSTMTVSVGSSATGQFRDTTHTVTTTSTSLLSYQITTGGTGTSIQVNALAVYAAFRIPLQSYTISEGSITVGASSIARKVIRPIATTAISVTQTLVRKVKRPMSETAITVSDVLTRRGFSRSISEGSITVGASVLSVSRKFVKTITEGSSITVGASTLVKKVIHPISESAITLSQTLKKKVTHSMSEPSISVSQTLLRKVIRPISEPAISVTQTIKKKVSHFISETSITVTGTVALKIIRPITATTVTVSQTLTRLYKANRPISEPSISVSSSNPIIKLYRTIVEPAKTVSDSIIAKSPFSLIITEPSISVAQTLVKKVTHFISEPAKTISDTYTFYKVFRYISEPAKTITDSFTARKVSHFLAEPAKSISDSLSRFKKAVRSLTNTVVVGPSVLTKTSFNFRNLSEPAINNILDSIESHHKRLLSISEPAINISDVSSPIANRKYFRAISEVPPINVIDIVNVSRIAFFEKHILKQGLRFLLKRPEDTNLIVDQRKL